MEPAKSPSPNTTIQCHLLFSNCNSYMHAGPLEYHSGYFGSSVVFSFPLHVHVFGLLFCTHRTRDVISRVIQKHTPEVQVPLSTEQSPFGYELWVKRMLAFEDPYSITWLEQNTSVFDCLCQYFLIFFTRSPKKDLQTQCHNYYYYCGVSN